MFLLNFTVVSWCCGQVQSPNDVTKKIENAKKNTHTTIQKRTNNGFLNTKKRRKDLFTDTAAILNYSI